jgi:preprotein translocase subunit SecD
MKTILYSIIAILIFSAVAAGYINKQETDKCILIQSVDRNIASVQLTQSAEIISNRLKDFSSEKFVVTIIPEKKQIQVILAEPRNLKAVENLLVQKGAFAFYETYDGKSLTELLQGDNHLFSLMNDGDANNSNVTIGCITPAKVEKVNDYTKSLGLHQKCKFAWSQGFDSSEVCLYALRLSDEKGALLTGADVESMRYIQDQESKTYNVEILFKKDVIKIWSDATKRNINRSIALVLDNEVIYAPRVNEAIDKGHCIISGNLTEDQVRFIAALGNNGELPANFEIVK